MESVSQLADVGGQPALTGLKDALLGFGEAGEIQLEGELVESPFGLGKARLQLARCRSQRRNRGLTGLRSSTARIAQEGLSGEGVRGHAAGGEKGPGLTGAKAVTHDGFGQTLLLPTGKRRGQGVGDRGREAPVVDVMPELGAEATAQGQAPIHPGPSPVQELGDLGG